MNSLFYQVSTLRGQGQSDGGFGGRRLLLVGADVTDHADRLFIKCRPGFPRIVGHHWIFPYPVGATGLPGSNNAHPQGPMSIRLGLGQSGHSITHCLV